MRLYWPRTAPPSITRGPRDVAAARCEAGLVNNPGVRVRMRFMEMKSMKKVLPTLMVGAASRGLLLGCTLSALAAITAQAQQQTSGAPGSPDATTTIDGRYIPPPTVNILLASVLRAPHPETVRFCLGVSWPEPHALRSDHIIRFLWRMVLHRRDDRRSRSPWRSLGEMVLEQLTHASSSIPEMGYWLSFAVSSRQFLRPGQAQSTGINTPRSLAGRRPLS